MKSILYVGGALMIAAGIYGFADFKKTNASPEFKSLYQEKEIFTPGAPDETHLEPTRDVIIEPAREMSSPEKTESKQARTKKSNSAKKSEKELDPELFSRAPLREIPKAAKKPMAKSKGE